MSLLSPKLRIALTPDRVAVVDGRGYREAEVAAPGWAGALEALASLLDSAPRKGQANVTLSQHFAQTHLLPPPPVVLKPIEMQGWIHEYLQRQLGETGRALRLAWQVAPPGEAFIVGGMAPNALAELEAVIKAAGQTLAQVQPWLALAWNHQRRRLGRGPAWFALAEPGRLTLAGLENGRPRSLRSVLSQGDPVAALADLLTREALLAGEAETAPLWVESLLPSLNWQRTSSGRTVHPLDGGSEAMTVMLG